MQRLRCKPCESERHGSPEAEKASARRYIVSTLSKINHLFPPSGPVAASHPRCRHNADVGPGSLPPLRVRLPRVLVRYRAGDDHVITLSPVYRGRDLVLGSQLQRVDDAEHLVEIATGRHWIDDDELDLLIRADDKYIADRLVVRRRSFGRIACRARRQHPIELRDR